MRFYTLNAALWSAPTICTISQFLRKATAETAITGGLQRNTVSEVKLKNRRTGSTLLSDIHTHGPIPSILSCAITASGMVYPREEHALVLQGF